MSMVPPRHHNRQGPQAQPVDKPIPNIVPTGPTRRAADRMVHQAQQTTGADAAAQLLWQVKPQQIPALIGLLLNATKPHRKVGRPVIPLTMTPAERREAHRLYRHGDRSEFAVGGHREYNRVNQRVNRTRRVRGVA